MASDSDLSPATRRFLQRESAFKSVPPDILQTLSGRSRLQSYRRGELLYQVGDAADVVWLWMSGWVRVFRLNREGEPRVLLYRTAGELVGETGLLGDQGHDANAEVYDDSTAIVMGRSDLLSCMDKSGACMRVLLVALADSRSRLSDDLVDMSLFDTKRRVVCAMLTLMDRYGTIGQDGSMVCRLPMTLTELAGLVGATRETVSRICAVLPGARFEQRTLSIGQWEEFKALNG